VLPYQLFTLKIASNKTMSFLNYREGRYFIMDSLKQLENAINNQELTKKYYSQLDDLLTSKKILKDYLKEATTWSTYGGFHNNGVYTPDGTINVSGENNRKESVPYHFANFLNESDDWSRLNLAAVNMIMSEFRKNVIGNCDEITNMIQYMMAVLGLPSYNIIVGNLKSGLYTKSPVHEDIMFLIPTKTLEDAEKIFGSLIKYENAISPLYPSETQIRKVLDPIKWLQIALPHNYESKYVFKWKDLK